VRTKQAHLFASSLWCRNDYESSIQLIYGLRKVHEEKTGVEIVTSNHLCVSYTKCRKNVTEMWYWE